MFCFLKSNVIKCSRRIGSGSDCFRSTTWNDFCHHFYLWLRCFAFPASEQASKFQRRCVCCLLFAPIVEHQAGKQFYSFFPPKMLTKSVLFWKHSQWLDPYIFLVGIFRWFLHTAEKVFDRWREERNYVGSTNALSVRWLAVTGVDGFVDSFTVKIKGWFIFTLRKEISNWIGRSHVF